MSEQLQIDLEAAEESISYLANEIIKQNVRIAELERMVDIHEMSEEASTKQHSIYCTFEECKGSCEDK